MFSGPRTTTEIDDATVISDIRAAMDRYYRYIKTKNADGSCRTTRQDRAAAQKHTALIEAAAVRFGELNGWRRTEKPFRVNDIGRQSGDCPNDIGTAIFDHCIWYRGNRRCAAIVAQPYPHATYAQALAIAARYGVACHAPPRVFASFHFPAATKFFVFTGSDHRIVWLPEQSIGCSTPKAFGGARR